MTTPSMATSLRGRQLKYFFNKPSVDSQLTERGAPKIFLIASLMRSSHWEEIHYKYFFFDDHFIDDHTSLRETLKIFFFDDISPFITPPCWWSLHWEKGTRNIFLITATSLLEDTKKIFFMMIFPSMMTSLREPKIFFFDNHHLTERRTTKKIFFLMVS